MIQVSYNRACLNCLTQSGFRHLSIFADNEFQFDSNIATWEMRGVWKVKKSLVNAKVECDNCSSAGLFDVWDLEVNDKKSYFKPEPGRPWTRFFIDKKNGELEIGANSIELGSNITVVTFFDLILQVIKDMPEFAFISHKNGFFEASVFYIQESDQATFNMLRHSGLTKNEILTVFTEYREIFKSKAGFYKS